MKECYVKQLKETTIIQFNTLKQNVENRLQATARSNESNVRLHNNKQNNNSSNIFNATVQHLFKQSKQKDKSNKNKQQNNKSKANDKSNKKLKANDKSNKKSNAKNEKREMDDDEDKSTKNEENNEEEKIEFEENMVEGNLSSNQAIDDNEATQFRFTQPQKKIQKKKKPKKTKKKKKKKKKKKNKN